MFVYLNFEELGITDQFSEADIINRACDMVMSLMFPEFEEEDVYRVTTDYWTFMDGICEAKFCDVQIPIKIKYSPEF